MPTKKKKLALKLGIQTYQILTNDDEVCSLTSILLAVPILLLKWLKPSALKGVTGLLLGSTFCLQVANTLYFCIGAFLGRN